MKKRKLPKYSHHKATGQAYVRLNGRTKYLGLYNSPESHERYAEVVDQWRRESETVPAKDITIGALSVLYLKHAERYYRKRGRVTSEVSALKIALRHLLKLFRRKPANQFVPQELKLVRQSMIDAGYVRLSINRHIGRIVRMFRWGGTEELVARHVYHDLKMLDGLKRGRTDAVESSPVRPVHEAYVDAIKDFVSRPVWGMIQLQLATGMRPGEVMALRGCDLNMQGPVWEYVPESHKTEHHGKSRIVFIGPAGQAVLREYLKTDLQAYLFSPIDARREFDEQRKANRTTPMTPSQRARKPKAKPKKKPGERYTSASYGYAVRNACFQANVPPWSPNQLRHNFGTKARREFGIEAARVTLGHSSAVTSEIYAEKDWEAARAVVARIG